MVSSGTTSLETVPAGKRAAAEAWRLLIDLVRSQRPRFVAIAAEFDLTPMQAHALHILGLREPVAMSELAETLACDASNVTGIVDRLESRGLALRRGADHDRRIKMLVVTPRGWRVRAQLEERLFDPPPSIAKLSRADQRALREILARALENA